MAKSREELMEARKQMLPTATAFSPRDSLSKLSSPLGLPKELAEMEQKLRETWSSEEDSLFYYHRTEDRVVLSHAMFWTMTFSKIPRPLYPERGSTSPCIPSPQAREKLRFSRGPHSQGFCIALEPLSLWDSRLFCSRKLAAIAMVAAGYAGDMDEELANDLLDDIDYHFNKVKCRKIEQRMPKLMKMVESEMEGMK